MLGIPKTSLHRDTINDMKETVAEAKKIIDKTARYILHFDGKAFLHKSSKAWNERNCYVVTRTDKPQELTLGVPYLKDKTAESIADVVHEWGIKDCITGISFYQSWS